MNIVNPNDIAKWFCSKNIIDKPNTREANMKIQKLLFFAQLIYMAKNNGKTMFDEEFKAFKDGVILETVMNNYRQQYKLMFEDIKNSELKIDKNVEEVLNTTIEIFGDASAQELSELSHEFDAWKYFFNNSKKNKLGFYSKKYSIIPYNVLNKELYRIEKVLEGYELSKQYEGMETEDY